MELPAFPYVEYNKDGSISDQFFGLSIRDYFAAKAMQGIMLDPDPRKMPFTNEQLAQWSYQVADAMLAERDKK